MVWSIGVPRPSQVTVCVRGPAHPGPDHPHDGCRRRGRERGNPACPTPFGTGAPSMRSLTLGVEERYRHDATDPGSVATDGRSNPRTSGGGHWAKREARPSCGPLEVPATTTT